MYAYITPLHHSNDNNKLLLIGSVHVYIPATVCCLFLHQIFFNPWSINLKILTSWMRQFLCKIQFRLSNCAICRYVDDTLIILKGCATQLFFLKSLLHSFSGATSLRVNYSKSMKNIYKEKFCCFKASLHFTYLGLPFGTFQTRSWGVFNIDM